MQTERLRVRRRKGRRYVDEEVEVPAEAERLRIAHSLHSAGVLTLIEVLGWKVLYKPRWTIRGHTQEFDPLTGRPDGPRIPSATVSEACCTFGHLQEWSVCYTWTDASDQVPVAGATAFHASRDASALVEGARSRVEMDKYERNSAARHLCIEHYGAACFICGFDFGRFYGSELDGFIHVHHLRPISQHDRAHVVDPIQDLRPLCANCHCFVHSTEPPLDVNEARERLTSA